MPPTLNDVIRIVASMSQAGNDIQNVFHAKISAGTTMPNNASLLAGCAQLVNDAYDNIDGSVANNVTFENITAYNLTQDEYVGTTDWPTLTTGGGASGSMLPPQTAALVLFLTSIAKSLGKKYLPPLTTAALDDDGSPTAAILTGLGLFASDLISGYAGPTWTLACGNWRPLTSTFVPWLSGQVRDLFATQRRRYTGRGT